jgi:hypothetical protein
MFGRSWELKIRLYVGLPAKRAIVSHPRLLRVYYVKRGWSWYWCDQGRGYFSLRRLQRVSQAREDAMIAEIQARELAFGHPITAELRNER